MERLAGSLVYTLTYKKVKNLNLRVRDDLTIAVSAPRRIPPATIDRFVLERADWISKARERMIQRRSRLLTREYTVQECQEVLGPILRRFYPIFQGHLPQEPQVSYKAMKSRWGICYPDQNRIVLNTHLLDVPQEVQEYVVLHELTHFLHPDHQQGFHKTMARLMPDYQQRRKILAQYVPQ